MSQPSVGPHALNNGPAVVVVGEMEVDEARGVVVVVERAAAVGEAGSRSDEHALRRTTLAAIAT